LPAKKLTCHIELLLKSQTDFYLEAFRELDPRTRI